MGKRILYISYDGMTDPLGQSQVIPYLKGLSNIGYLILIVSAEKKERFYSEGESLRKQLVQNEIGWFPVFYSNEWPGISAYSTYRRLRRESRILQTEHHFDIVHCRSYIPSLIGLEMKKKSGVKFIFDMRGFWADERVEGGIWNLKNPWYRKAYSYFKEKEEVFLEQSDSIVSLTEKAKQEILSWQKLTIAPEKISVIPCCADGGLFSKKNAALDRNGFRDELGIGTEDFVLCYSGSVGTWYLLKEMLQFFNCLLEQRPASKFLFITTDNSSIILQQATKLQLPPEKIIIRASGRDMMPKYLDASDAAIFFIKNSFSKKASSPTKMGEFMSMGIPIICNSGVGDIDAIMRESNAGIVLPALDEQSMRAAVWKLLDITFSKQEIRDSAVQFFSLESGVEQYHEIYDAL